jgi:uncharacterized membrane protein YbhN (UPF0104 family)
LKSRLPTIARAAAPFILTALLLWLMFSVVDPRAVLRQLAAVRPAYLAAAILLMVLSIVVATLRYQTVLETLRPLGSAKFFPLLGLNLLTLFCAHFVPFGAIADAMRALVSRRLLDMPVGTAVEGVIADRVLAVAGFALFGLLLLPLQISFGWPWALVVAQAATFGGSLLLIAIAFGVTRYSPRLLQPVAKAVRRFAAHVSGPGDLGRQLGFAAASVVLFAAMLMLLGTGLNLPISTGIALAVTPAIYLSQVIPIFYAGFGSRELALAALLVPSGVLTEADAVALGLSIGLCNLAASLPGAVSAWPLLRASGTNAISQAEGDRIQP